MSRGHEQYHRLLDDDEEFISYDDGDLEQTYRRRRKIRHGFHLSELKLFTNQIILTYSSMFIEMIQDIAQSFRVSAKIHILPSS